MDSSYDVIVIGAGLGGLSAATLLAKEGQKVLLLERHNVPGGYATSFVRGRFEFEVALHELSGIGTEGKPGYLYKYLDSLGVAERVEFIRLPNLYRSIFPGLDLTLPAGGQEFEDAMVEAFPHEAAGIRRLLGRIYATSRDVAKVMSLKGKLGNPLMIPFKFPHLFRYLPATWGDVLRRDVKDPAARGVLSQYWGYVGLPPSSCSFINMALTISAYVKLYPSFPKRRSQALSNAFVQALEAQGGEARMSCGVRRIVVREGRVAGVITEAGEEIAAPWVVSNTDPITTCRDLIGDGLVDRRFLDRLRASDVAASTINVYLGIDRSPEELGIGAHEIFINDDYDVEGHARALKRLELPRAVAVTTYNLAAPDISPPGTTMLVITALMYGDLWARIRPEEYVDTKNRFAEAMIRKVERHIPGVRDFAEEVEVSTPVTNMRFASALGGSIYGFDAPPWDNMLTRMSARGPVQGLCFAGAWTQPGGGFQPAITSGQVAAAAVLRGSRKEREGRHAS
jgi:prolycopene isomerase